MSTGRSNGYPAGGRSSEPAGSASLAGADEYASTAEAANPYCLRPGEASSLLAGHPWRRFLTIGDSVASGVGDPVDGYMPMPWADRIAVELQAIEPDVVYLNLGEREVLAAEVRIRQLDAALAFHPDLTLVVCGGNDALGISYKPDEVDAEMIAIISALRDAGSDVITIGLFDVSFAPAIPTRVKPLVSRRMRTLSARTASIGERLGTIHVSVTSHPNEPDATMYSADGLHGNFRSHAICAAEAIRALGAHLAARADR